MLHAEKILLLHISTLKKFLSFSLNIFPPIFLWKHNKKWEMIIKLRKYYDDRILFIRKKNTKNNNKTCVELQLINSLCYFWDDWWWCTHDVKVSMKVLIKNLFFVWKKMSLFLSYNFCTVIPRWWVNWNIHVNQIATFVPCEPAQIFIWAGVFYEKGINF